MPNRSQRHPTSPSRHPLVGVLAAAAVAAIGAACAADLPTAAERVIDPGLPALAKPSNCNASVNLRITMGQGLGGTDALRGDDIANTAYQEGVDGVGAHLSGVNGNLMLTVQGSPNRRYAWVSTAGSGLSDDRLYTNSHTNPGGSNACGLDGLPAGGTGSAVLEAELAAGATGAAIIRYGKTCGGSADAATRVTTMRSADGNTWTITGTAGVHCDRNSRNKLVQVGTAGPFSMVLERL